MNALRDFGKRIIVTLIDLATSKKAIASTVAVLMGLVVKDPSQRDAMVAAIVGFVLSQSIVDHAKAKVEGALGVATETVTATASTPVVSITGGAK